MRVLRAKLVRKHLKFYKLIFGITAPYNVILDGNFIYNAVKYKMDVRDRLEKLLQGGEVKLFVLRSAVQELESVGAKAKGAKDFATTYCEIIDDSVISGETPSDRIISFVDKAHQEVGAKRKRYMVATQDQDLRRSLGQLPGVPLVYLNLVTLVLEAPSHASVNYNKNLEVSKTALSAEEAEMLTSISSNKKRKRAAEDGDDDAGEDKASDSAKPNSATNSNSTGTSRLTTALPEGVAVVSRKKHRARAPNPLSNAKPKEDSKNSAKKEKRKYRKFY